MHNVIQLLKTNNVVYAWNEQKNLMLEFERGICFEEIVYLIESGCLVEELEHPNQEKCEGQKILVVDVGGYAYLVPCKNTVEGKFLKTIIPSRKATKEYIKQSHDE
ncbi:toxin [Candidatus Dojkabacteria bacterium]|uniref:Toxin n=1 Tax=Candidatus Dojkabacteria bacterium TaxID=2099670 RepID=A0A955L0B5_9BACT|nr:toxin [Candidatus Dojkabacteria bacterium]